MRAGQALFGFSIWFLPASQLKWKAKTIFQKEMGFWMVPFANY
jgi:hypothetical protein